MNSQIDNCASVFYADVIFYAKGHYPRINQNDMDSLKNVINLSCGGGADDKSVFEMVLSTAMRYCTLMEVMSRISNVLHPRYISRHESERNKSIQTKLLDELLGAISIIQIAQIDDWDELMKHKKLALSKERDDAYQKELEDIAKRRETEDSEIRKQELEDAEYGP